MHGGKFKQKLVFQIQVKRAILRHYNYSTTYFYIKTSYFDFINLAVGQRMNEIRRFGFLVTDSESLTQYSNEARFHCDELMRDQCVISA